MPASVVLRPMGIGRRMGVRPCAQPVAEASRDLDLARQLLNRSLIAGRDGSISCTRATGRFNPLTGQLLGNNTPAQFDLNLAGIPLPFFGAWDQRTNICPNSQTSGATVGTLGSGGTLPTGWTGSTPTGLSISVISFTSNSIVFEFNGTCSTGGQQALINSQVSSIGTVPASSTICGTALVSKISGTATIDQLRCKVTEFDSGPTYQGEAIANGIGLTTAIRSCTASASRASVGFTAGRYPVNSGDVYTNYRVEFSFPRLFVSSFPGPYIPTNGSAVTHDADLVQWTIPGGTSAQQGEMTAIFTPYLWSTAAGAAHPSGQAARIHESSSDYLARSTSDSAQQGDGGTQLASVSGLADSSGSLRVMSRFWDASGLYVTRGGVIAASDTTLSPPWVSRSSFSLCGNTALDRMYSGFSACIYTPGGASPSERQALSRLLTGRQLAYLC